MPIDIVGTLLGGAASGLVGGLFGDDEEPTTGQMYNLTPAQMLTMQDIYEYLRAQGADKTATPYTGERVAGMSDAEKQSLDQLGLFLGSNENTDFLKQIQETLSGIMRSPTEATSYYQQYLAPAAKQLLLKDVLPTTREAYVGPGTYWGSARAQGEQEATNQWATDQSKLMGEMLLQSMGLANTAAGTGLSLAQYLQNAPLEKAKAAQALGLLPRSIAQAQLDAEYQEFLRTVPEASPWLQKMMDYIKVGGTVDNYAIQGNPSILSQLLGAAGPVMTGLGALGYKPGQTTNTPPPVYDTDISGLTGGSTLNTILATGGW